TPALEPKLLLLYGAGISVWTEHLHKGLKIHRRGVKTALETGDTNYAVYHIQSVLIFLIASGAPIDNVSAECERYFQFVKNSGDAGALNYLWSVRYYLHGLQGEGADVPEAVTAEFDEARHVAKMEKDGIQIILLRHFLLKLRLLYTIGDIKGALVAARAGEKLLHYHLGTLIVPEFHFFHALALAAACPTGKHPRRHLFRRKIKGFLGRLYALSRQCPENFEHKYLLAAAEYERISGRDRAAMAFYHQAGRSARENGFIQFHALANELAAKFYKGLQLDDIARNCLTLARDGYRKWGAHEKVRALEKAFPELSAGKLPDKTLPAFDTLDFSAVIHSLQTISTDIVFEDLLKSLLPIMLENAGATKTQFLTIRTDQMYLEAEHTVNSRETRVFDSVLANSRSEFFLPVLNYVRQTGQLIVVEDAAQQADYTGHPYMEKHRPRSVLCLPVLRQTRLIALLYLENRLTPAVFTPARIEILELLASQAAISLENARLYENVLQKERALREVTRQREAEALQYQSQLRSLSSQLSLTEERERRRIATQLHDRIGHALTNASMRLSRLRNSAASEDDAKCVADEVHGLIEQSIQDTQTLTFELSPPILYDLGLEAAIDWLAEQTQAQHGITVSCVDDMVPKSIDESLRVLLFQAARELLFNVVKHARASQATISISRRGEYVSVAIEDDGIGFDAARARRRQGKKGGFGLFSIQERMAHQGGRLEIHSEPGKGSRFNLISPMKTME
ncbi:MAG TPA: ATP-binding protein, partial [Desulfosalsimonadaceae bacterium]|nr:ATP-binding protein [Desulfosalsimonadaceae bacterium]